MAKVVKYPSVWGSGSIPGGGGLLSQKIPCLGSRAIIFSHRATSGAFTLTPSSYLGAFASTDPGYFSPVGVTLIDGANNRVIALNGAWSALVPTTGQFLIWSFLALQLNGNATGGNNVAGCAGDAFVMYEGDRDKLDLGQDLSVVF